MKFLKLNLFLILLISCNSLKNKTSTDLNYTIIEYKKYSRVAKNALNTKLNNQEIVTIEKIIKEYLKKYNEQKTIEFRAYKSTNPNGTLEKDWFVIELDKYVIQYVPYINSNGEKEIWIQGFCNDGFGFTKKDLKREIIEISDGGNCVFSAYINLPEENLREFYINGIA